MPQSCTKVPPETVTKIANIRDAPTGVSAKITAKQLPFDQKWQTQKLSMMYDIHLKKQANTKITKLTDSKSYKLVEAVQGELFWGSDKNKEDTLNIETKYWFGKTEMENLLMDLR